MLIYLHCRFSRRLVSDQQSKVWTKRKKCSLKILSFSDWSRFKICSIYFNSKTSLQRGSDNASSQNTVLAQPPNSPKPGPFPSHRMAHISTLRDALAVLITSFCCKPNRNYFPFFLNQLWSFPSTVQKSQKCRHWFSAYFNIYGILLELTLTWWKTSAFYQEPMTQLLPYFPSTSAKQDLYSWG